MNQSSFELHSLNNVLIMEIMSRIQNNRYVEIKNYCIRTCNFHMTIISKEIVTRKNLLWISGRSHYFLQLK